MIYRIKEGQLNVWHGILLASLTLLSACSDDEMAEADKPPQSQTSSPQNQTSVQQQPAQPYLPPAAYPPPAYAQRPPAPGYAPGQYYAPQPPPRGESNAGSRPPDNPWSGRPPMGAAALPSWRQPQGAVRPGGYPNQPPGMTGQYRPLNSPPETSNQPGTNWNRAAPGYAPPPYPNGYRAYSPPGSGYGSHWPGGFPGGYGPHMGW